MCWGELFELNATSIVGKVSYPWEEKKTHKTRVRRFNTTQRVQSG